MKCIQILQNGFKIFKISLFLVPVLEKFRVVGVSTVDYVRRTNHENRKDIPLKDCENIV